MQFMGSILDREEYVEQGYFFRILRERLLDNRPTQETLDSIGEEILSITRLPYAIDFLAAELRHTGILSSGFNRLTHYFTPFQGFIIRQSEDDKRRFNIETALLVLEREAEYRAGAISPQGLFVYQFETISRNRLSYVEGIDAMKQDPIYQEDWRVFLTALQKQIGIIDFAELLYLRSDLHIAEQKRKMENYQPPLLPLFGEKEGKIAKANRGRDPLYLFAALQRQLGYPKVPRPKAPEDITNKFEMIKAKIRELEARLKLVEGEQHGKIDLSEFMFKPGEIPEFQDEEDI